MNFIFPYTGNVIIPTDFHIFQRGWNHQPDEVLYYHYLKKYTYINLVNHGLWTQGHKMSLFTLFWDDLEIDGDETWLPRHV